MHDERDGPRRPPTTCALMIIKQRSQPPFVTLFRPERLCRLIISFSPAESWSHSLRHFSNRHTVLEFRSKSELNAFLKFCLRIKERHMENNF